MLELEEDLCPAGCVPPENAWDLYRGRIAGNYRIVYRVFSEAKENPHHSHSTPKHRVRGALKQTNAGWARFHPPPNHTPVTADCGGQNDNFAGPSIEEARINLIEALTLFSETADPSEVASRFHDEVFVTQVDVLVA